MGGGGGGVPEVSRHNHLCLLKERLLTGRVGGRGPGDDSLGLPSSAHLYPSPTLVSIPGIS